MVSPLYLLSSSALSPCSVYKLFVLCVCLLGMVFLDNIFSLINTFQLLAVFLSTVISVKLCILVMLSELYL